MKKEERKTNAFEGQNFYTSLHLFWKKRYRWTLSLIGDLQHFPLCLLTTNCLTLGKLCNLVQLCCFLKSLPIISRQLHSWCSKGPRGLWQIISLKWLYEDCCNIKFVFKAFILGFCLYPTSWISWPLKVNIGFNFLVSYLFTHLCSSLLLGYFLIDRSAFTM